MTVIWTDEGVAFASWKHGDDGTLENRTTRFLEAALVTPGSYRQTIEVLTVGATVTRQAIHWIVLAESYPHKGSDEACVPVLPGWVTRCWDGLGIHEIPAIVQSGRPLLEQALSGWTEGNQSGSGVCLRIGERILFLGQGNGIRFSRLSRKGLADRARENYVSREWLLQTRLLFRNRTGSALRRVWIPRGTQCHLSWQNEPVLEIIPGLKPPSWISFAEEGMNDGLAFMHLSALCGPAKADCRMQIPALQRRRRGQAWDRRLKTAACLLIGGWGFLLLGACRHGGEALPEEDMDGTLSAFRSEIRAYETRWQGIQSYEEGRKAPYRLVGLIAGSKPEAVEIRKIHMERTGRGEESGISFEFEGVFDGDESSAGFREWVESLQDGRGLKDIRNLRFDRSEERIRFSLQGTTRETGGA